jgi:GNAT superfamily N-acetyltransferase
MIAALRMSVEPAAFMASPDWFATPDTSDAENMLGVQLYAQALSAMTEAGSAPSARPEGIPIGAAIVHDHTTWFVASPPLPMFGTAQHCQVVVGTSNGEPVFANTLVNGTPAARVLQPAPDTAAALDAALAALWGDGSHYRMLTTVIVSAFTLPERAPTVVPEPPFQLETEHVTVRQRPGTIDIALVVRDKEVVTLEFKRKTRDLYIGGFFFLVYDESVLQDVRGAARRQRRTIAGRTMEWIGEVAHSLDAATVSLTDAWHGRGGIDSELLRTHAARALGALNADPEMISIHNRASKATETSDAYTEYIRRMAEHGFYGPFGFEPSDNMPPRMNVHADRLVTIVAPFCDRAC